jgi:regulator of protease activity HflC (stomatin/prohibitin superfamily)
VKLGILFGLLLTACNTVPAGHVGIKVYLLGGEKGVDTEVLGTGRYWIGMNEELFLFPTYEQNPKYTTGDNDSGAPISLQTKEGLAVEADVSVTYVIERANAAKVFQRYRQGIDEINKGPLRNILRDAFNEVTSTLPVESVYGEGKVAMVDSVQKLVTERASIAGITVTQVSLLGAIRLPPPVVAALNSKIEATQRAQQRENELREAEAQARKAQAEARGLADAQREKAKGDAEATWVKAEAQARANRTLAQSITASLIEYEKARKWNGTLPQVTGNTTPMLQLSTAKE